MKRSFWEATCKIFVKPKSFSNLAQTWCHRCPCSRTPLSLAAFPLSVTLHGTVWRLRVPGTAKVVPCEPGRYTYANIGQVMLWPGDRYHCRIRRTTHSRKLISTIFKIQQQQCVILYFTKRTGCHKSFRRSRYEDSNHVEEAPWRNGKPCGHTMSDAL